MDLEQQHIVRLPFDEGIAIDGKALLLSLADHGPFPPEDAQALRDIVVRFEYDFELALHDSLIEGASREHILPKRIRLTAKGRRLARIARFAR